MQNSVSPKNKRIEDYYNSVALDYKLFWNLNRSFAVRIGLWDKPTRSLPEALRHEDEILSKLAGIRLEDRVLDAGCGVGGSAVFLAKKFGCFVTGITLSQSQVGMAKAYAQRQGVAHLTEFLVADFNQTNLPSESFDVVWAIESVSHNDDFRPFLKESRRLLKPKGRLVTADYYRSLRNFQGAEKLLHEKILKGLAFATFNYEPDFREGLKAQGFGINQFIDVTEKTLPSARLMHHYAGIGLTVGKVLEWLRLRDWSLSRFSEAAQGQYQALKSRMHMYKILSACKES